MSEIKIKYTLKASAIIKFDNEFEYHGMGFGSLADYVEKAKYYMQIYNFEFATIEDADSGATIATIEWKNDDCDFDLPEYYDDGETCGYE